MKKFIYSVVFLLGLSTMIVSCNRVDNEKASGKEKGHEYVDLGLPSGTMWATCNVGASSPEYFGDYFAWGETTTKNGYDWRTYKWCNGTNENGYYKSLTKYNSLSSSGSVDNKTVLDSEDDAAHVNWGDKWSMPTMEEWQELLDECEWTWTTDDEGYKVTSKSNGNSIFLPAGGNCKGTIYNYPGYGYYWSSSLRSDDPGFAWGVGFGSYDLCRYCDFRSTGRSVRPVCHKK